MTRIIEKIKPVSPYLRIKFGRGPHSEYLPGGPEIIVTPLAVVKDMKVPETKTQVRQILGFFSWFRDYISDFALHAKALTDLTGKRVPAKVPWGKAQQEAFDELKELLCKATMDP